MTTEKPLWLKVIEIVVTMRKDERNYDHFRKVTIFLYSILNPPCIYQKCFFFFWQIQAISFFLKHSLIVLHLWKLENLNKIPRAVFPLSFTSRTRNKEEEKNPNRILSESHFFEFLFLLLEHQQFKVFRGTQMCSTTVLVVACS